MLAQLGNHTNLFVIWPVAALAWLSVARMQRRISQSLFCILFALLWIFEFSVSTEVFATTCLLATITVATAWLLAPQLRTAASTRTMLREAGVSFSAAVVILLALFLPSLLRGYMGGKIWSQGCYSIDAANFFIPTETTLAGSGPLAFLWRHFAGTMTEQGGYIGLPLLLLIALFGWEFRNRNRTRILLVLFSAAVLLSLGPQLRVFNQKMPIMLPWYFLGHLPIMQKALPGRLVMFATLAAGLMAALWPILSGIF